MILTTKRIYCDYNSTTPILPEVHSAMMDLSCIPLNPSSIHFYGRHAKSLVEEARISILEMLGIDTRKDQYRLAFTSSATEANNLIISNFINNRVISSSIEHPSILKYAEYHKNIHILPVDQNGVVDLEDLEKLLKENTEAPTLVSIMLANNETGVIQPIKDIANIVHQYGALIHSDCVQSPTKMACNIEDLGVDFMSISAHKFGGPLGAAALIYKSISNIEPQILGGGQERGVRSGTQNVPAIVGFGIAAKLCNIQSNKLRNLFELKIQEICDEIIIFGQNTPRIPNTSMVYMPNVPANIQLIKFDISNICVSTGSACSSGVTKPSHVLLSMGIPIDIVNCSIRYSFGQETTIEDINKVVDIWKQIYTSQYT